MLCDIGEEQGKPFIAMELTNGHTLRERIKDKPLSAERVSTLDPQIDVPLRRLAARARAPDSVPSIPPF